MDLGLRGKVALVAAASRGLGRAIAFELANEGAKLILCARGAADLEVARNDIATRTGVRSTLCATTRTTSAISACASAAPMQRRIPPPNGSHAYDSAPSSKNRSGRNSCARG